MYSLEVATDIWECAQYPWRITFFFLIERTEEKLTEKILIAAIETLFAYPLNSN